MSNTYQSDFNNLHVASWRYFETTGSTNDDAFIWANDHAPDMALVVADQQTRGRGRADHAWVTNPGSALAFSLVLRPTQAELPFINRFTALAALALVNTLHKVHNLDAEIKWPNDVLLFQKKVAGILVEIQWNGPSPDAIILGMGVNVTPDSIPSLDGFHIEPTCIDAALVKPVDRWQLLEQILNELIALRAILPTPEFIAHWNNHLAFRGQTVTIHAPSGKVQQAIVLQVSANGSLLVKREDKTTLEVFAGELEVSYNKSTDRN